MKVAIVPVAVIALASIACDGASRDDDASAAPATAEAPVTAPSTAGATASATELSASAPYDVRFIDTMTAHHEHGIEMAELALAKANSAEVKQMAQKMVDDQEKDQEQLRSLREQWYAGAADAHDMSLPGAPSMSMDMAPLQAASGAEFDRAFLAMMVPHHQGAADMGRDAATKAEHPELRSKAQEIADKQQREIEQIETMRSSLGAG